MSEKESQLESILSSLDTGLSVINPDHTISWVNEKIYQMFPEANPIGQICHRFYESSEEPCKPCPTFQCFKSGRVEEIERFNPANKRWYRIISQPIKDPDGHVINVLEGVTDITERKNSEESLRQKHEMLKSTEAIAHVGSWEWEIATGEVTWSEELFRIFQLDPDGEAPNWAEHPKLFPPEDFERLRQAAESAIAAGKPYELELRALRKDGEIRICKAKGFPEAGEDGQVVRFFGLFQDITERKQIEAKLEQERKLFKTIVDQIPVMLTRYDPDVNMLFLNSEFERKVGWTTQEVQNIDMMEKVYPDPEYRQKVYEYMQKATTEWKEFHVHSKSGDIIESEWSNIRLEDGTQIGIGIDITDRKKAEKDLRKSEMLHRKAQQVAKIGHWELDSPSGTPIWSEEIFRIFGLDPKTSEPSFAAHVDIS